MVTVTISQSQSAKAENIALFKKRMNNRFQQFEQVLKEQTTLLKYQDRIANCGQKRYHQGVNRKTGVQNKPYTIQCGLCPKCYAKFAKEDALNFGCAIAEHGSLKSGFIPKSLSRQYVAAIGKDNLKKYPQGKDERGDTIYKIVAIFDFDAVAVKDMQVAQAIRDTWRTWKEVPALEELQETVQLSKETFSGRESGLLDKKYTQSKKEEESIPDNVIWHSTTVEEDAVLNASGHEADDLDVALAWRLATAKTADLDPKTIEEQQEAYNTRRDIYLKVLKAWGYKVSTAQKSIKIGSHEIQWDLEYAKKIFTIYESFQETDILLLPKQDLEILKHLLL